MPMKHVQLVITHRILQCTVSNNALGGDESRAYQVVQDQLNRDEVSRGINHGGPEGEARSVLDHHIINQVLDKDQGRGGVRGGVRVELSCHYLLKFVAINKLTKCLQTCTSHDHITCTSHDHHMHTTCTSCHTITSHAHHMITTCTPHDHHMYITCTVHDHCMYITCTSHAHHMITTCTPHAQYMIIACTSQICTSQGAIHCLCFQRSCHCVEVIWWGRDL